MTQELNLGLCDNLEGGGMGWEAGRQCHEGEGTTYVNLWLIHADVGRDQHNIIKAIILQLKRNTLKNDY